MDDLDFETLENMLYGEKKEKTENKEKKHRERSRHSKKHKKFQTLIRKYSRSNSREKKEKELLLPVKSYQQERKEIQRVRLIDAAKAEEMQKALEARILIDQKRRQLQQQNQKYREVQKEIQQSKRQDLTVLVNSIPTKAKEKDIFQYFTRRGCGKIRDIRIIKDPKTNVSKGVAYVQFCFPESVQRALMIPDMPWEFQGRQWHPLRVQHSQAQKNRAAAQAKKLKMTKTPEDQYDVNDPMAPNRILITGLAEKLSYITDQDLKSCFEPFGLILYVEVNRDSSTGRCKGQALIQYKRMEQAKKAVKKMNGMEIGSCTLKVSQIAKQSNGKIIRNQYNEINSKFLKAAEIKINMMQKISKESFNNQLNMNPNSNLLRPPISTTSTPFVLMTNMFSLQENNSGAYFDQLKIDIEEECRKFGELQRVTIEFNSQGNVWLRFRDNQSAVKMQQAMNSIFFDGRKIFCYFVTENTYKAHVKQ